MGRTSAVSALVASAGSFGPAVAQERRRLLAEIVGRERLSPRELGALHDVLCFLRAYPDDVHVRRAVEAAVGRLRGWLAAAGAEGGSPPLADTGYPGTISTGEFSLPLLQRMRRRLPDSFEIDWEAVGEDEALLNGLSLLVTSGECQGLDDIGIDITEWFQTCRPDRQRTDLGFLVDLFARADLEPAVRDVLFDTCHVPLCYRLAEPGTGRAEIAWPVDRVHYQTKELDRTRRPLASVIRRPLPAPRRLSAAAGERFVHLAQRALCARSLEIRTLSYANGRDVTIVSCGRGIDIVLVGVVPRYRDPLESHFCSFVLKNGVPIGYGPSTVSLGCCELGLNLFPEFRGAEVRYVYPQLTRVLHQVLGAQYFFLTPYGMGEGNPAAIRTGAFWFYRKLGFRPTNPEVEELARAEERRLRREPGVRSSPATLRRLSHTSAFFDLSGGTCRPLDLGRIGMEESRRIDRQYGGDRRRAVAQSIRRVARALGKRDLRRLSPERYRAWEMLAPLLATIPGLEAWSAAERRGVLRILHRKGGVSEIGVDQSIWSHSRLRDALQAL